MYTLYFANRRCAGYCNSQHTAMLFLLENDDSYVITEGTRIDDWRLLDDRAAVANFTRSFA